MNALDSLLDPLDIFNPEPVFPPLKPVLVEPPPRPDYWGAERTRSIMAFDQAIANTGWVVMHYDFFDPPLMYAIGTIKVPTLEARTSWDDTLERSTRLMGAVVDLLYLYCPDLVLHEMPPVGTGPFVRAAYSSVVAATAVRCAAATRNMDIAQVSANSAKKCLTGNGNAKKPEVRKAVQALIDGGELKRNPDEKFQLNEHITDAIALAWTYGTEKL
jgi:Holliday junction resolvasome RuvABC endonuclease subunit